MLFYDLSLQSYPWKRHMGHVKTNTRHAHENMMKKNSPCPKKKQRTEMDHTKRSSYTIHNIHHPHTCTSWSGCMTCFSKGSDLWLSNTWGTGMPSFLPTYCSTYKPIRSRLWKKGNPLPLWGIIHIERSKSIIWGTLISFEKLCKTSGLTADQRMSEWCSIKLFYLSTTQDKVKLHAPQK